MERIAVLLTCFNRRDKTINALEAMYIAQEKSDKVFDLTVYLTDDGSTDGTGKSVKEKFPNTIVLEGTGNLYWAGGMRNSWAEAIKSKYDAYLLLNDDTDVFENVFDQLFQTHEHSIREFGKEGVYIGSTQEKVTKELSYGGAVFENRFLFRYRFLQPNGKVQNCELGNANIMLVGAEVVSKIGILSEGYVHGVADYDYTLKALKSEIPVLLAPEYCGHCTDDHNDIYENFHEKTFLQRYKMLKSPLALDFKSNFLLQIRHFPLRAPFVALSVFLKLLFPKIYKQSIDSRRV